MDISFDHLTEAVLLLPIEERAALAARIVESIENEQPKVSSAWLETVERRRQEIVSGKSKTLSADEVSAHVRRHLQ
jgi:putative addiction module component (TIGR02574 family)